LPRRRFIQRQHVWEYGAVKGICAGCVLRAQCTRSKTGRTLTRHEHAGVLEICRAQSHSAAAKNDRQRRQYLIEGSFADAANNHGFKRARWRRLWRQQIQDYLIAAIQNIRILLSRTVLCPTTDNVIDLKEWLGGRIELETEKIRPGKVWKTFCNFTRRSPRFLRSTELVDYGPPKTTFWATRP
jgi:hypothetical protein